MTISEYIFWAIEDYRYRWHQWPTLILAHPETMSHWWHELVELAENNRVQDPDGKITHDISQFRRSYFDNVPLLEDRYLPMPKRDTEYEIWLYGIIGPRRYSLLKINA